MVFAIVFAIVVGGLSSSILTYADSNDRVSTFINMAAGKQLTDIDLDSSVLSEEDIRFLGVYISNFFVPFGTELGSSGNDDDLTAMNKEDIVKALQTSLNFSDSLAESLTETLLGLSRSSVTSLVLCVSKEYQKDIVPVSSSSASIPLNGYTFLSCMLGGLKELVGLYDSPNTVMQGIENGDYEYGYFAYQRGSEYIPVFDFDIDMSELTASSAAFIKCIESIDIENGCGFSFFDFTEDEMGDSEGDYKQKIEKFDNDEIYRMSIYGTEIKIDCFGNIIFMGGNHQYVAIPGCMNPYTWVKVDEKGSDIGEGLGGTAYNMINVPSMSLYDNDGSGTNDNTLFTSISGSEDDKVKSAELETRIVLRKLISISNFSEGNISLRRVRGSNEWGLSSGFGDYFGGSAYRDLAKKAEWGFEEANKTAHNYYDLVVNDAFRIDSDHVGLYIADLDLIELSSLMGYGSISNILNMGLANILNIVVRDQLKVDRSLNVFDSFIYIDSLGAYHFDNTDEKADFSTFNVASYTSETDTLSKIKESMTTWGNSNDNGFTNTYENIESGKMIIPASVSDEALVGIYVTYAYSSLYDGTSSSRESTIGKLGYRMNNTSLPSIPDDPLTLSDDVQEEVMLESIRDWLYYLLHPTEGLEYFKVWITNKLNSFLLGWHDDMVGTNGSGSINGTTKYRGFSGYVTTPELTDIPWTNSLLNMYNSAIPFLLVIMILIMLGAYVVGVLSFQKAIIGLLIFVIGILLPSVAINGAVGTANRFSSNLYGEKFTYWALVQHESYSDAIDDAAEGDSYSNYLMTLYSTNSLATGNQGDESIMIKWQAPKKMASLMLTNEDEGILGGLNSSLLSGLLNSTYSGENYLDDSDSVYLYRSYIDIANFSRYIHRGLADGTKQPINQNITNDTMKNWSDDLKEVVRSFGASYESDRNIGYTNNNADGSASGMNNSIIRVRLPLSSKLVNEQLANIGKVKDMDLNDYVGINQDAFQFSIPMFNAGEAGGLSFKDELKTDNFNNGSYTNEDFSSLAAYGLMSESPFYYFSWYLYETGLTESTSANDGYRNLLLSDDNAGFFYNTKGNGEMKDFMDMKSLFTYIIPYLKECNELVYEWDGVYGIYIYEGVPTEEGHENDPDIKGDPELQQKYWHNLNVARLYNMYTPWVDIMYDCSYADAEKISYLGEEYVIEDPIDPSAYPDERPMIFSRSEMLDYGLKENNLTKVEKLILECQDGMQERLFKLLNYHTFNDVVLNTAAAINCTFEFNTVFSENSIIGANHNLYPQSFELNDFSYDAFLRFILSNSTGESMIVEEGGDFYSNITNSSSMTTIIVMLILDILSMYVIPGFKVFFIVGIFLMFILLILVTAFRVDQQQKFVTKFIKNFVKPIIQFLLVTCGMSVIVSWFMGEGNTSITGSLETSISLGDPVMAMLVMIVLNVFVIYFYFKILLGLIKNIKKEGSLVVNFVGGVAGSVGGALTKGLRKSSHSSSSSSSESHSSSQGERVTRRSSSTRAEERGSSNRVSDKEHRRDRDSENRSESRFNIFSRSTRKNNSKSTSDIEDKTENGLKKIRTNSKKSEEGE